MLEVDLPAMRQYVEQLDYRPQGFVVVVATLTHGMARGYIASPEENSKYARRDLNPQPSVPKTDALSNCARGR